MLACGLFLTQTAWELVFLTPKSLNYLSNFFCGTHFQLLFFQDDSFKEKKKNLSRLVCFPNRTNKRLSGSFNVQALCHCLSSQIEKQMISNTWCFIFFPLHSNPAVCSGLLIYFITGSCQGRALSAGRRAACRIPAEWVHAGLVCAEMPWISSVLRCRVQAKACNSSVSSLSLVFCFRTLHGVCMLRRGAVLRSQSHWWGGAGGSGPVCDCSASGHAVRAPQQFL